MKKLVLLLSFVFALGLFSVNAQVASKKTTAKSPAKTEKVVKKKTTKTTTKKSVVTGHKASKKAVVK